MSDQAVNRKVFEMNRAAALRNLSRELTELGEALLAADRDLKRSGGPTVYEHVLRRIAAAAAEVSWYGSRVLALDAADDQVPKQS